VNDGYRLFINSHPKGRWNFLTPTITIEFVAGQAVYDLPAGFFGSVLVPWTYDASGPRRVIGEVPEPTVRAWIAGGDTSGDPAYVAYRPKNATNASTGPRWEAVFWPTPTGAYTVTTRARLYPEKLTELGDRHIAGFQHDETIIAAALAEAERQRNDAVGIHAQNYQAALARSVTLDREAAPKRIGDYGDRSDDRSRGVRPYTGVDTYNNVPV
jgi:hypothetical protein